MIWTRIKQGEGKTGLYLVAFYHLLQNEVKVGIGSCIDGNWHKDAFTIPIAWMPLPTPPTLESLNLVEWAKQKGKSY